MFHQSFRLPSSGQKYRTTNYMIAICGVLSLQLCLSQKEASQDSSEHWELLTQPYMHEYDLCNIKINNTPKRDPNPLWKIPNFHPSIPNSKCQKSTHPQRQSLNNHPASAFDPHHDWWAAGKLIVHFLLAKEPSADRFTMWRCLGSQATSSSATTLCS